MPLMHQLPPAGVIYFLWVVVVVMLVCREALATRPSLKCIQMVHMEDPEAKCDGGDVLFTGEDKRGHLHFC